MKKQIAATALVFAAAAMLIAIAFLYADRKKFSYTEHLEDVLFSVDGEPCRLGEAAYYIAKEEYLIERQAMVYNPDYTNQYWSIHTNGAFLRLKGKDTALNMAIHDMLLYEEAKKREIALTEEEEQYAFNSASDLAYDLGEECLEHAGLTMEQIFEMTKRAVLAQKYQGILAKESGRNFGAYDDSGTAYEAMRKEHEIQVDEDLWDRVPFGNVFYDHRFQEEDE